MSTDSLFGLLTPHFIPATADRYGAVVDIHVSHLLGVGCATDGCLAGPDPSCPCPTLHIIVDAVHR